jgi:sulfide:quinone oxidoreductase
VDVDRREARTASDAVLRYDALLLACGAVPDAAVAGALTFRGPADSAAMRDLLGEVERGDVGRVAFAVPWGATWALPAYELALMTAAHLSAVGTYGVELSVVTPEAEPLQLFGHSASDAVQTLLDEAGIDFVGGVSPVTLSDGKLLSLSGGSVAADRVVALPRLRGQRIDGIPQTVEGFVSVDEHCGVRGADAVFAAGDITSFPIKQGGIASQQADAAAEHLAYTMGVRIEPQPFRPVLRGELLTGADSIKMLHTINDGEEGLVSPDYLWWPRLKVGGRYLSAWLAGTAPRSDLQPREMPIEVEASWPHDWHGEPI